MLTTISVSLPRLVEFSVATKKRAFGRAKRRSWSVLSPQDGSLWHAYRRQWACSRKDLLDVDIAQAGGWSSLEGLKSAYQRPDGATMLRVIEHDAELRAIK